MESTLLFEGPYFLIGLYLSILPFGSTKSSVFNFFKSDHIPNPDSIDLESFSEIPVLRGGRVKPLDSVARNTLLVLRNKRTALDENGSKIPAIEWLANVLFNPDRADQLKTFVIDHDQVLGLLDRKFAKDGKFYSYNELEPYLGQIDQNAREAGKIEREKQDSFDQNIIDLYRSVLLYRKLKHTLTPPSPPDDNQLLTDLSLEEFFFDEKSDSSRIAEYRRFRELTQSISANADAIRMGSDEFAKVVFMLDHYSRSNLWSEFFPIPPEEGDKVKKWRKVGESMVGEEPLDSQEKETLTLPNSLPCYANLCFPTQPIYAKKSTLFTKPRK